MLNQRSKQHTLGSAAWLTKRRPKPLDPKDCKHPKARVVVTEKCDEARPYTWVYAARCNACRTEHHFVIPGDVEFTHVPYRMRKVSELMERQRPPAEMCWIVEAYKRFCEERFNDYTRRF